MYNWSTDTKTLSKNPEKFAVWRLEQLINFGLKGEKLNLLELKKYFNQLKIDPQKKTYLKFLMAS